VNNPATEKKRHWCLTLFLAIIFFSSFYKIIILHDYSWSFYGNKTSGPHLELSLFSLCHCVSAILIFKWKKWGFWLFAITACLHMLSNFWYFHHTYPAFLSLFEPVTFRFSDDYIQFVFDWIFSSLSGFIGLVSLYALLQIGGAKKAWTQLEEPPYVEK